MTRDRELPPPLEMICLNALWDLGEANVESVRQKVSENRPLAYTTVLTLLDRLTRRGAVARRREGRGFRYRAIAERNKLRRIALHQFLEVHFESSVTKLRIFLEAPVEYIAHADYTPQEIDAALEALPNGGEVSHADAPAQGSALRPTGGKAAAAAAGATGPSTDPVV